MIGYEDRFVGVKETEFEQWELNRDITEETFIPCRQYSDRLSPHAGHRVKYFKQKGEIVWDRDTRYL